MQTSGRITHSYPNLKINSQQVASYNNRHFVTPLMQQTTSSECRHVDKTLSEE